MLPDPSSLSDSTHHVTEKINIDWTIDFTKKVISGTVVLLMKCVNPVRKDSYVLLDTNELAIHSVQVDDKPVPWRLQCGKMSTLGSSLIIEPSEIKNNFQVKINYETSPNSSALQWLEPQLTADRKQPFVYSQCQAIHARSLYPCQDTPSIKFPYIAKVTAPKETVVIMGATRSREPHCIDDQWCTYYFEQTVPIPSYLMAIACGDLAFRKIGPRSSVWAEPSVVDKAAHEFSETEQMLQAAEELCGPYVWGVYDILVLPPAFPYGGMENPCLTFVSPTLLAGDRCLANVIAHEIAHSWTGNLVTNSTWEHFWLNEGHTMYLERLIMERLKGTEMRHLLLSLGYDELLTEVNRLGSSNPLTKLVPDLTNTHPDSAYNRIPYEKGSLLLYYLETHFGKDVMLRWLKSYIMKFSGCALDSKTWLEFLETQLGSHVLESKHNWDHWFYCTGLPTWKPIFHAEVPLSQCDRLTTLLSSPELSESSHIIDEIIQLWKSISTTQQQLVLHRLAEKSPLSVKNLHKIDELLHFSRQTNAELRFEWSMLCVRSRYSEVLDSCFEFLNSQGRMRYTRPLYSALNKWPEIKSRVIANFEQQRPFMHQLTAMLVSEDLQLNSK